MRAFLKTYYLMKSGDNFYDAFPKGMSGWLGVNFHTDLAGWREPFLFYLWSFLPGNGESIYYLGLLIIMTAIFSGYAIAKKFLSDAKSLMIPFLLLPYFYLPLSEISLLQVEWWGLIFLIIGLAFYVHKHPWVAGIFFILSLASREIFLIPILSIIAVNFFIRKTWNIRPLIICLTAFCVYFFLYHIPKISLHQTSLLRSTNSGDWHILNTTFAYSSWNYLLGSFRPFIILFITTTSFLIFQIIRKKWHPTLFLMSLYLPIFGFALIVSLNGGLTPWHDYWGIYFVPLLIIVSPIALDTFSDTFSQV